MDYSDNNRGLRPSTELDDSVIENIKSSYLKQTLPVSVIVLFICAILMGIVIVKSIYNNVTIVIMIISSVLFLFLFARIIAILILAGRIRRGGFNWTKGIVTGYECKGTGRNYHIYVIVSNLLYCMLLINNLYSKGTNVYVLSMRVFSSEENIIVKI